LHSGQHKKASDHKGKKVVVVGACTSGLYHDNYLNTISRLTRLVSMELAHDIAADYYDHGVGELIILRITTAIAYSSGLL